MNRLNGLTGPGRSARLQVEWTFLSTCPLSLHVKHLIPCLLGHMEGPTHDTIFHAFSRVPVII